VAVMVSIGATAHREVGVASGTFNLTSCLNMANDGSS